MSAIEFRVPDVGHAELPIWRRDRNHRYHVAGWTKISHEDVDTLAWERWHITNKGYVFRYVSRPGETQALYRLLLHRAILGLGEGDPLQGDHVNGDTLDNRRENLRAVTAAQNSQNVQARTSRSGHRGVYFHASSGLWRVAVSRQGRVVSGGYFHEVDDAVRAATALRAKVFTHVNESRSAVA